MERSIVFGVPETTIKIVSELLEEAIDLIEEKTCLFQKQKKDSLMHRKTWKIGLTRKLGGDTIVTTKTCQFEMEVLIWNEMRF